jgi:hypothetical protein
MVGELGAVGAGERAESGELVLGTGALLGDVAKAFVHRVPLRFELVGLPHGGGEGAESLGVLLGGLAVAVAGQPRGLVLLAVEEFAQCGVEVCPS